MPVRSVQLHACFEAVQHALRPVALLTGAGCSRSSEILLAGECIRHIKAELPYRYALADQERRRRAEDAGEPALEEPSFNEIADHLADDEWLRLMWGFVKDKPVNLAHVCIAELIRCGWVDRVLTVNFDPLLSRACSIAGVPLMICDCVSMPDLDRAEGLLPAVYHLHGQAYGMGMLVSRPSLENRRDYVQNIVRKTIQRRVLIVVGYSGDCDGVVDFLRDADPELRNPVFWVPFDGDAHARVVASLGSSPRSHLYVTGPCDADRFFHYLTLYLHGSLPEVLVKPGVAKFLKIKLPDDAREYLGTLPVSGLPPDKSAAEPAMPRVAETVWSAP